MDVLYTIKVSEELNNILIDNAKNQNNSVEKLIIEILTRYAVPTHMMDSDTMRKGYAECGEINLEWANL